MFLLGQKRKGLVTSDNTVNLFKGKMKVALYLADLNTQFENWGKAYKLYQAIYKGKYGKLTKDHLAAAILGMDKTQHMKEGKNWKGPLLIEKHLKEIQGAKMESKVLFDCACLWMQKTRISNDEKIMTPLCNKFERVIFRSPNSIHAENSIIIIGRLCMSFKPEKSIQYFTLYLKKYPKGALHNYSQKMLEIIE